MTRNSLWQLGMDYLDHCGQEGKLHSVYIQLHFTFIFRVCRSSRIGATAHKNTLSHGETGIENYRHRTEEAIFRSW